MPYKAEYIWIDGTEPTAKLRSKTKVVADGQEPPILVIKLGALGDFVQALGPFARDGEQAFLPLRAPARLRRAGPAAGW